ncbi:MAG: hypothetical protein ACYC6Y_24820 [Thermoguttaceae bacterium]
MIGHNSNEEKGTAAAAIRQQKSPPVPMAALGASVAFPGGQSWAAAPKFLESQKQKARRSTEGTRPLAFRGPARHVRLNTLRNSPARKLIDIARSVVTAEAALSSTESLMSAEG